MGEPDGQLSQSLPQVTLLGGSVLPRSFENFVRVKRHPVVEKTLSLGDRLVRREAHIVGNARDAARCVMWQWTAESVAGPRIEGLSSGVPVAFGHTLSLTAAPRTNPPKVFSSRLSMPGRTVRR